jgi:hypothetical protein
MMCSGLRAGGVISLRSIWAYPLASKIDGSCLSGIAQNNVYQTLSSFYINLFASYIDYELVNEFMLWAVSV